MSKKNSKRLYEHYVNVGYDKAAQDLLKKYPEFNNEKPKEVKDELPSGDEGREVKSKGDKRRKK